MRSYVCGVPRKPGLALWMLLALAAVLWNTRHERPEVEASTGGTAAGADR